MRRKASPPTRMPSILPPLASLAVSCGIRCAGNKWHCWKLHLRQTRFYFFLGHIRWTHWRGARPQGPNFSLKYSSSRPQLISESNPGRRPYWLIFSCCKPYYTKSYYAHTMRFNTVDNQLRSTLRDSYAERGLGNRIIPSFCPLNARIVTQLENLLPIF